jgi:hypothetical protein
MPRRVVDQARVRRRAAAAALVEENDAIAGGVVIPAHGRVAAAARTAMDDHHRLAVAVAAFLEVDLVVAGYPEASRPVGFDRRIETELLA